MLAYAGTGAGVYVTFCIVGQARFALSHICTSDEGLLRQLLFLWPFFVATSWRLVPEEAFIVVPGLCVIAGLVHKLRDRSHRARSRDLST